MSTAVYAVRAIIRGRYPLPRPSRPLADIASTLQSDFLSNASRVIEKRYAGRANVRLPSNNPLTPLTSLRTASHSSVLSITSSNWP